MPNTPVMNRTTRLLQIAVLFSSVYAGIDGAWPALIACLVLGLLAQALRRGKSWAAFATLGAAANIALAIAFGWLPQWLLIPTAMALPVLAIALPALFRIDAALTAVLVVLTIGVSTAPTTLAGLTTCRCGPAPIDNQALTHALQPQPTYVGTAGSALGGSLKRCGYVSDKSNPEWLRGCEAALEDIDNGQISITNTVHLGRAPQLARERATLQAVLYRHLLTRRSVAAGYHPIAVRSAIQGCVRRVATEYERGYNDRMLEEIADNLGSEAIEHAHRDASKLAKTSAGQFQQFNMSPIGSYAAAGNSYCNHVGDEHCALDSDPLTTARVLAQLSLEQ